jgi:carbon-monoxide dehydrogenase medium subunit
VVHRKIAFNERPAATVTCLIRLERGRVAEARVAVGSVGVVPRRSPDAEAALIGPLDESGPARAGEAAAAAAEPVEDRNGSVDYKRNLVRVLVQRAAREAIVRAA